MMRAVSLACLSILSTACQPGPAGPSTRSGMHATLAPPRIATNEIDEVPGRAPSARERHAIDRLLRTAEEIRSLSFEREVPFRIQSREAITQFVRDEADAEELERARVFYVALGLLPADLDVRELIIRVLGEQIVGYYDPDRGLMVIREDVAESLSRRSTRIGADARALGESEMVIVHELVHALQDQRLGLGIRYHEERTIDAENAFAAVVEGDATLAMIGHMAAANGGSLSMVTQNTAMLRALIESQPTGSLSGQEIENAPPIVRLPLVSRYLDGLLFCATLHGREGWPSVDRAHTTPPASSEQILHPERYLAGEGPDAIVLPAFAALAEAGFTPHEEETLGELEMGIYFGLGSQTDRDAEPATGWGGDRLRVYVNQSQETAVVWFTSWDNPREATEAEAAFRAAGRSDHVVRDGRAVMMLRNVPASARGPIVDAFTTMADALPGTPPTARAPENVALDAR